MPTRKVQQTFNDGAVMIFKTLDSAKPGEKPVKTLEFKESLRYTERTVGIRRHYTSMQANAKIDRLIRCPLRREVSTQDVAATADGIQYHIDLIQYPEDVIPPSMDLTLRRLTDNDEFG